MAYIMRHKDKSGNVNVERVLERTRELLYNSRDSSTDPDAALGVRQARNLDRQTNGFKGKKRHFRRIGTIPVEDMQRFRKETGGKYSHKDLKRFVRKGGFNTVGAGSF